MNARRWIITVVACLLVFVALAAYKVLQIKAAIAFGESFPEPSETVEAEVVALQGMQQRINTVGEIIAPQMVVLHNELEGRIHSVNFRSGDRVEQGAVLLQLDVSEEQARLQAAQARAELARLDLQRVSKLIANNTVSEDRLDQARAQYAVATADIQALQAVISKKTIKAPFAATAGIHQFEAGEYLPANTLVTTLVGNNQQLWVDFQLPLSQASIAEDAEVEVSLPGFPAQRFSGQLIARDSALSAASRNLRYRARLQADPRLLPHAIVNVTVVAAASQQLPRVPVTAVRQDAMGSYVYVLQPDNSGNSYRASRRAVKPGAVDGLFMFIVEGLQVGDLIATQGAFKLRENILVYVKDRALAQNGVNSAAGE